MLEAVSVALCAELSSRGINAFPAWPNGDMAREGAQVAVSLKNARISGGGFGDYLGAMDEREEYGLMCRARLELDVYTQPEDGFGALSRECDKLINALWDISGGAVELELGDMGYDKALCCLRCRGILDAGFWLVKNSQDSGEITDFTVKGMILHGDK